LSSLLTSGTISFDAKYFLFCLVCFSFFSFWMKVTWTSHIVRQIIAFTSPQITSINFLLLSFFQLLLIIICSLVKRWWDLLTFISVFIWNFKFDLSIIVEKNFYNAIVSCKLLLVCWDCMIWVIMLFIF
jgi:hypothetical protein